MSKRAKAGAYRAARKAEHRFWRTEIEAWRDLTIASMPFVKWENSRLISYPIFSYTGVPFGMSLRVNERGHIGL